MIREKSHLRGVAVLAATAAFLALSSPQASAEDGRNKGHGKPPAASESQTGKGSKVAPRAAPEDRAKARQAPETEGCPFDGGRKLELIV